MSHTAYKCDYIFLSVRGERLPPNTTAGRLKRYCRLLRKKILSALSAPQISRLAHTKHQSINTTFPRTLKRCPPLDLVDISFLLPVAFRCRPLFASVRPSVRQSIRRKHSPRQLVLPFISSIERRYGGTEGRTAMNHFGVVQVQFGRLEAVKE